MTLVYIIFGCILVASFITGVVLTSKEKKQKTTDSITNNIPVATTAPSVQNVGAPTVNQNVERVVPNVHVVPTVSQVPAAVPVTKVEVPNVVSSVNVTPTNTVSVAENIQTTSVVPNNIPVANTVMQVPVVNTVPVTVTQQNVQPVVATNVTQPNMTSVQASSSSAAVVVQQNIPVVNPAMASTVTNVVPAMNAVPVNSNGDVAL